MSRRFWKTADFAPPLEQPEHVKPRDLFGSRPAGNTTQTQTADPWAGAQPYLYNIFNQASSLNSLGPYKGPYISPRSDYSRFASDKQAQDALDPKGLTNTAQGALRPYINGDFLSIDKNPAIQAAVDAAKRTVNSQFSGDNYGSSAHQEWLTRAATNAAAPLITDQQNKQLAAIGASPSLQAANPEALAAAGSADENRQNQEISAAKEQYYAPWDLLQRFQGSVSGQGGGQSTSTSPYFTNPLGNAAGLGMLGGSIFGPIGAGAGALIGLLGSR
jgi:hypothetical protein